MGVIENRIDITELERSGGGGGGTAASVSYDNTSSHMTATDVQAALDELNLDIAEGLALVNTSVAANREAIIATQETIAPVEDEATSSAAYAVGDQLIYNNLLYKVTASIAIGDTITPGTNVSLADEVTGQIFGLDYKMLYFTGTYTIPTGTTAHVFSFTGNGLARVEELLAAGYNIMVVNASAFTTADVVTGLVSLVVSGTSKEVYLKFVNTSGNALSDVPIRALLIAYKIATENYSL